MNNIKIEYKRVTHKADGKHITLSDLSVGDIFTADHLSEHFRLLDIAEGHGFLIGRARDVIDLKWPHVVLNKHKDIEVIRFDPVQVHLD